MKNSKNNRKGDSWKSDNYRKRKEEKKPKIKKMIKSDNFTSNNKEKSNIAIAIL